MSTMAYVHPREREQDVLDAVVRNAARALAVAAYAAALVIAFIIFAPVFDGSEATADITPGPATVTYRTRAGDTPATIASRFAIPLAELYALNPGLQAIPARGERLVVGFR